MVFFIYMEETDNTFQLARYLKYVFLNERTQDKPSERKIKPWKQKCFEPVERLNQNLGIDYGFLSIRSHFLDQVTDVLTKDFEGSMYYYLNSFQKTKASLSWLEK